VRELLDYVVARHYPEARDADVPALAVLQAVAQRQAALIADWMLVGFIHGVMNTTIWRSPARRLTTARARSWINTIRTRYSAPSTIVGGYAYANQPAIAQWNLARLAETLLPLIDSDFSKAVSLATE